MNKSLVMFVVVLLALGGLLVAGPDFSGNWKLDLAKSDFGPMPGPSQATQKITHSDPALAVQWMWEGDWGQMEGESKYSTDGTETTNSFGEMSLKATASWDGDKLKIHSTGDFGGNEATFDDVWELSEDGNTMKVTRTMSSPMGEMAQTLIWVKE